MPTIPLPSFTHPYYAHYTYFYMPILCLLYLILHTYTINMSTYLYLHTYVNIPMSSYLYKRGGPLATAALAI